MIPFDQQFFVEKQRNNTYEWLVFIITLILLGGHGLLFHWIPKFLRMKRTEEGIKHIKFFKFLKNWDKFTSVRKFTIFKRYSFFYQPSLVLFCFLFVCFNVGLCFAQIKEIDYQGQMYPMSKRISRVAVGNLPILLFSVAKNDILTNLSGFQFDRLEFLHKWLSRWMWILISIHLALGTYYWLSMNFRIMIIIPPQIFGFMAYGSFCILTWGSMKFIRKWSYDFFLIQHRVFAFIMLFMSFIHNPGNRAAVLISVHGLVIDRVISKIMAYIHKNHSPTKCKSTFEILDENTIEVTIPIKTDDYKSNKWFNKFLSYKNWKAGQHIYLNVAKVKWFQYHPFTIASVSSSNDMKLLIRVQKGFTKKLMKYLSDVDHTEHDDELTTINTMFHGPYGAVHQPFITFDHCLFFSGGSGGAFTFPVCLDLLKQIDDKNMIGDYLFRPRNPKIRFVWVIKKYENIIWFKHILDQLIEYSTSGRLIIDIYITQERKHNSVSSESTNDILIDQTSIESNSELLKKNNNNTYEIPLKQPDLIYSEKTIPLPTTSTSQTLPTLKSSISTSSNIEDISNLNKDTIEILTTNEHEEEIKFPKYNIYYGRPNIGKIIKNHSIELTKEMKLMNSYKTLSVASCGPPMFTNLIKEQCQEARKIKNSPDVYCYTESF
ncbi:FRP1 [Candida pseudojiufengensis]|uniref:FRP1 n=1 Tax=Candida pseudojiufengensis TaxID=497109 RepID=UPI002224929B|nr:FRP1 [Candida pseudojiufengensis]KAI5959404.1 FRP1 [Candida pseudojiufengensis]